MSAPKKPSKKGDAPKGGAAKAPGKPAGKAPAKAEAPKAEAAPAQAAAPAPKVEEKAAPAPAPAAAPSIAVGEPAPGKHRAFRRKLVGRVTSNKMAKTVVVEVVRSTLNPMYKKYVRSRERYKAHDETNQYKVGDRVEIQEHRPISREKRWLVTRLISRPVEE